MCYTRKPLWIRLFVSEETAGSWISIMRGGITEELLTERAMNVPIAPFDKEAGSAAPTVQKKTGSRRQSGNGVMDFPVNWFAGSAVRFFTGKNIGIMHFMFVRIINEKVICVLQCRKWKTASKMRFLPV